jgi:hypothetical protein
MGAIAALVGGVTFAALQTNTVALTNNTLSSGTPLLQIGTDVTPFGTSAPGINDTLNPGIPKSFTFYLKNNDTQELTITASVPTVFDSGVIPGNKVTMALDCGAGSVSFTLDQWSGGSAAIPGTISAGSSATCHEVLTLDSTYSATGDALKPFDINFVGNETSS